MSKFLVGLSNYGYQNLSLQSAKRFVGNALHYSKDIAIGNGPQGPFDHLFKLSNYIHNPCKRRQFKASDLFLYAVTDSRMNGKWGRSITDSVKAAIEGGATIVQLRLVILLWVHACMPNVTFAEWKDKTLL